jgi:hypothetical protein
MQRFIGDRGSTTREVFWREQGPQAVGHRNSKGQQEHEQDLGPPGQTENALSHLSQSARS